MQNKNKKSEALRDIDLTMPKTRRNRRKKLRSQDLMYRIAIALNILTWSILVVALVIFHYARPEFITGVQNYWGIEGRDFWQNRPLLWLEWLLEISLLMSVCTFIIYKRRTRRKADRIGLNILIVFGIAFVSLATLYTIH